MSANPYNPGSRPVATPDRYMYRSEDFAGEGYRDPAGVLTHETYEMENDDAPFYMLQHWLDPDTDLFREGKAVFEWARDLGEDSEDIGEDRVYAFFSACLEHIREKTGKTLVFGLWLAREDVVERFYCDRMNAFTIDKYETKGGVVLNDLGCDGMFVAFENRRAPVSTRDVIRE